MKPSNPNNYDYRIDFIRALACGLVALVHFGVPTWTSKITEIGLIVDSVILAFINTGWIGVTIFLFISGYSLSLNKFNLKDQKLDFRQYFINRFLRIMPLWTICITILIISHKINGQTAINLFFLQLQDMPPSTAFNIGWSLQLEVACYFLFPVFYLALKNNNVKQVLTFYLFFLGMRMFVLYLPTAALFQWSYGSIFGGATVFLSGMMAAKMQKLTIGKLSNAILGLGIICLIIFTVAMWKSGGYQNPIGLKSKLMITFMPEILSLLLFLVVKGYLTEAPVELEKRNYVYRYMCYFGQISYSAYLLSLFNLDLCQRIFSFVIPSGWLSFVLFSILYFAMLTLISSLSFFAIEKTFLDLRKTYTSNP